MNGRFMALLDFALGEVVSEVCFGTMFTSVSGEKKAGRKLQQVL